MNITLTLNNEQTDALTAYLAKHNSAHGTNHSAEEFLA